MDLRQLLQQFLLDQQHEILLMGDFNEDINDHHGGEEDSGQSLGVLWI
jgi:hypothetical protein